MVLITAVASVVNSGIPALVGRVVEGSRREGVNSGIPALVGRVVEGSRREGVNSGIPALVGRVVEGSRREADGVRMVGVGDRPMEEEAA